MCWVWNTAADKTETLGITEREGEITDQACPDLPDASDSG